MSPTPYSALYNRAGSDGRMVQEANIEREQMSLDSVGAGDDTKHAGDGDSRNK